MIDGIFTENDKWYHWQGGISIYTDFAFLTPRGGLSCVLEIGIHNRRPIKANQEDFGIMRSYIRKVFLKSEEERIMDIVDNKIGMRPDRFFMYETEVAKVDINARTGNHYTYPEDIALIHELCQEVTRHDMLFLYDGSSHSIHLGAKGAKMYLHKQLNAITYKYL